MKCVSTQEVSFLLKKDESCNKEKYNVPKISSARSFSLRKTTAMNILAAIENIHLLLHTVMDLKFSNGPSATSSKM